MGTQDAVWVRGRVCQASWILERILCQSPQEF
jgi:hypothetical protein